ncbi:MAG: hypothetical protein U5K27_02745 [Desulfotignum sp.]|nr:hypothetical protein [Desulfotignum sp.]
MKKQIRLHHSKGVCHTKRACRIRGGKNPHPEEGLLLTKSLDWQINLELKDHGTDPVRFHTVDTTLAAVDAAAIPVGQVVISSFNHDWLDRVRRLRPDIHVQALVGESADDMRNFTPGRFSAYNINADLVAHPLRATSCESGL